MYPNRDPATVYIEREFISVIDPLKISVHNIGKFRSGAAAREEEYGRLLVPALLSVATRVRNLRYHHSGTIL